MLEFEKKKRVTPSYKVYRISLPTGESYIGFTSKSINKRWRGHYANGSKSAIGPNLHLFDVDQVTMTVLGRFSTEPAALAYEREMIEKYDNLLNKSKGGERGNTKKRKRRFPRIRRRGK